MTLKAIEVVRKIRRYNYENCKNMTSKEKIEYTKKLAREFSDCQLKDKFQNHQHTTINGLTNKVR